MKQPTIDNIIIDQTISLALNKTLIKIFPNLIGTVFFPPLSTDFLKETIQEPLKEWCNEFLSPSYSLIYRYNNGDPYWSLFLNDTSDFNLFMLRFGANKH
jgi:hypothetical protein